MGKCPRAWLTSRFSGLVSSVSTCRVYPVFETVPRYTVSAWLPCIGRNTILPLRIAVVRALR